MLGIKFTKFDSMTHVIQFKKGKIKREGRGLSFYYYSPNSSITAIPLGSKDIQFIFNETTKDFQTISIQGQITYSIKNPKQLSELLDFTLNSKLQHKEDNFEKLNQRLNNEAQTSTSSFIQGLNLKEALRSAKHIENNIFEGMTKSQAVELLGVEIISADVLAVRPTPEMAKALETETRESLQKDADLAIYERRNFAVEQERRIKESELNTEIAVQEKKKQIQEKEAEIRFAAEENDRKIRDLKIDADIAIEEKNKTFIDLKVENERKQADAKAYATEKWVAPFKDMDWKKIQALLKGKMKPADNIAEAFRELAENTTKVNNLNITPDLLQTVLNNAEQEAEYPQQQEYR